jgi:glycosyltransferase involved in cell wall biosynthesis
LIVAIDAQLTVGSATGIGEYVRGLVSALAEAGAEIRALREMELDPWRFDRRIVWDQLLLPLRASRTHAAVLHCASGTVPMLRSMPIVATVHDAAWLRTQSHAPAYARWYFGRFSLSRLRGCKAIVTDSEFSRSELVATCVPDPERIIVVSPGVASDFSQIERAPDRRTVLAVGTIEPRKNLAALVALMPRLAGARLVSVGPATPYQAQCRRLAEDLGVSDRVEFRGYVKRSELLRLYSIAAVAAVPSLYEGFGYAVAQALCAGVPCVSSDRASLPEVAAGCARLIPVEDEAAWVRALERALSGAEDAAAASSRARAASLFSWSSAAAKMTAIYREAAGV